MAVFWPRPLSIPAAGPLPAQTAELLTGLSHTVPHGTGTAPGSTARKLAAGTGPGPAWSPAEPAQPDDCGRSLAAAGFQQPHRGLGFPSSCPPAGPCGPGPALPGRGGVGERASTLLQKAGNKRELFVLSSFLNMVFIEVVLASLIG